MSGTIVTPFERVLSRLNVDSRNGNTASCHCPAHDDRTPSLSVTESDDGRVLTKCHADCSVNAIAAAIGLSVKDFFPAKPTSNGGRRIVATHDYRDETGELLHQVVRVEPKSFRQRRPNGRGGWEWKMTGTRRVPYRLPELLAAVAAGETVYVVEGEKDADALAAAGHVATCNPGGAGKWTTIAERDRQALADARVVVIADRDEPGRRHARDVATDLAGRSCHVTVCQPPDGYKDIAELLGAGHTLDDLEPLEDVDGDPPAPVWNGEPGHDVLDDTHSELTRYVALPGDHEAHAATLFVAATHAQAVWEHASRLVLKSPLKRCGKSRAQEVMNELVHRPLRTSNISVAALVRSIAADDPPTILLDEADTVFTIRKGSDGAEDLRGILNAGHGRGAPYRRYNASTGTVEECSPFAMAVVAGIGDMPDTIEDRAIVITMRRRAPGEHVEQFRRRKALPALHTVRDRLHAWVRAHVDALADAEPDMPAGVEDRAADVWEPLLAVADLAGGDWPVRARAACQALTSGRDDPDDGTASERLLADIATVFGNADRLPTESMLERLHRIAEAPWADWYGKPLTARGLAKLLRPYGIKSHSIRLPSGDTPKGFTRADFADSWGRYLRVSATSATAPQTDEYPDQPRGGYVADSRSESATPVTQELFGRCGAVADVEDDPRHESDEQCPVCGADGYDRDTATCAAPDCAGF